MAENQVAGDVCLQCGKSRADVKKPYNSPCATATGYEVVEGLDDWDRHHWRDWSNADLKAAGVLPEFYDEHRREDYYALPYIECGHHVRGHIFPEADVYHGQYLMQERGVCVACGKRKDSTSDELERREVDHRGRAGARPDGRGTH